MERFGEATNAGQIPTRVWQRREMPRDTFGAWADSPPKLLSDEQMRQFVVDGFLQIDSGLSRKSLDLIYYKMTQLLEDGDNSPSVATNPGNNIMATVPELRRVVESPKLRGALTSILGENYHEHAHRYLHDLRPKCNGGAQKPQSYHKDNQSPMARPTNHHPMWCMVLFYPQDTPPIMGPTGIIPGSQYDRVCSHMVADDRRIGIPAAGNAGTCTIVHFDLVHRGQINLHKTKTRFMLKLCFSRTTFPDKPSWDCKDPIFRMPKSHLAPFSSMPVWCHIWDWLAGNQSNTGNGFHSLGKATEDGKSPALCDRKGIDLEKYTEMMLRDHNETKVGEESPLSYAYWIASRGGKEGSQALMDLLESSKQEDRWMRGDEVSQMHPAAYALAASGACSMVLEKLRKYMMASSEEAKKREDFKDSLHRTYFTKHDLESGRFQLQEAGSKRKFCLYENKNRKWGNEIGSVRLSNEDSPISFTMNKATQADGIEFYHLKAYGGVLHENGLDDGSIRILEEGCEDDFTLFHVEDIKSDGSFRLGVRGSKHFIFADNKSSNVAAVRGRRDTPAPSSHTWITCNLVYCLGQMGALATDALPLLVDMCRRKTKYDHQLVRILTDAIGDICAGVLSNEKQIHEDEAKILEKAAEALGEILSSRDNTAWLRQGDSHRLFTANDQIRIGSATSLMKLKQYAAKAETAIIESLSDPCGYLHWLAAQCLINIGSRRALDRMMRGRWFDGTLCPAVTF